MAWEFLMGILDIAFGGNGVECLFLQAGEFLFMADIGAKGDDFGLIIIFEPPKDNRRVETAGICENDFHFNCSDGVSPSVVTLSKYSAVARLRQGYGAVNRPPPQKIDT